MTNDFRVHWIACRGRNKRLEMMRNDDMILGAEKIADDSMIAMEDDDNGFRGRKNAILGEWIWKKTHLRTV